jgi:hypothetical protein
MKCAKPVVMGIKTRCLLYVPSYANSLAKPTAQKMVGGESSFPSHSTPDDICHAKSHSKHPLQFLPYASNPRALVTFNGTRVADYALFLSPTIEGAPCYRPAYIPKPQPQVQADRALNFTSQYYFDLVPADALYTTWVSPRHQVDHSTQRDRVFQLSTSMIPSFIRGKYIVYSSCFLPMTSYQNDTALITVECHASSPLHL